MIRAIIGMADQMMTLPRRASRMLTQLAPGYYLHKPDAIADLGALLNASGYRKVLIISGSRSYQAAQTALESTLNHCGISWVLCRYQGECSDENALQIVQEVGTDWSVVVGVGGGKVVDLSKLVAWELRVPLITVPTLISNCAATTSNAVVYDTAGRVKESRGGKIPPQMTLVDDTILRRSPKPYFASGLGDTLVKPYEALVGATTNTLVETAALKLARIAADCVRDHGVEGLKAFAHETSLPVITDLTDAVILMGSLVGGMGGSVLRGAVAHAFHNALTMLPEVHDTLHGEKVAYGLLVQEALLDRPRESIHELRDLLIGLELPVSWATLTGLPYLPDLSILRKLADWTLDSPLVEGRLNTIGADRVVETIREVEAY